jgi:hypothetical protein
MCMAASTRRDSMPTLTVKSTVANRQPHPLSLSGVTRACCCHSIAALVPAPYLSVAFSKFPSFPNVVFHWIAQDE